MTNFRSSNCVFLVNDIAATIAWYREILEFKSEGTFPDEPPHAFGIISKDGIEIMLQHLSGYQKPDLYHRRNGGVWDGYFRIDGVEALYQRVSGMAAVEIVEPLAKQWYGNNEFIVRDLNGYVLVFSEESR